MAILENFILVKINAEKEKELAKEKAIQGYPTFVVANGEGATLERWMGYTKEMFGARTSESLADLTTIDEKRARYESSPSEADAARLARYEESVGEYAGAVKLYASARDLAGDGGQAYAMPIFEATYYGFRKDSFTTENLQSEAEALFASATVDPENLILAARMMGSAARTAKIPDLALPYVKAAVERTEANADEDVQKARKRLLPDYALHVLADAKKAVTYKRDSMKEGWKDDPSHLNAFAWWCFENAVNLDEAQTLAERGVELAEPGADRAMILDTVAEICHARGDCKDAVAWIKRAIEDAPENEHYQKQLVRFEEALAQQQGDD